MSDIIETLLLRNLREVFGEGDPARRHRRTLHRGLCGSSSDRPVFRPRGARSDRWRVARSHPNYVYTPHRAPQAVQDGGRLAWGSGPPGEPPRYTGLDVIIVRDEKIVALYVFLDAPPA